MELKACVPSSHLRDISALPLSIIPCGYTLGTGQRMTPAQLGTLCHGAMASVAACTGKIKDRSPVCNYDISHYKYDNYAISRKAASLDTKVQLLLCMDESGHMRGGAHAQALKIMQEGCSSHYVLSIR